MRTDHADYYQTHPRDLHLAFLFGSNGLLEARARALELGRKAHPDDPRFPLGLARTAAAEGRWPEAEALAMEAYGIVRGYLPALDVLYDVFRATGRTADQEGVGELLLETAASDPKGTSQFLPRARLEEIRRDLTELGGATPGVSGPPDAPDAPGGPGGPGGNSVRRLPAPDSSRDTTSQPSGAVVSGYERGREDHEIAQVRLPVVVVVVTSSRGRTAELVRERDEIRQVHL